MNNRRTWFLGAMLSLLLLILAGCKSPTFQKAECQFDAPGGIEIDCGYLAVPEDRSQEDSSLIKLHVAIYRTDNPNPAPDPVVVLQGGPGAYALDMMSSWLYMFNDVRNSRDLIVFDQRGVGYSQPSLNCPEAQDQWYQDWTMNLSMKISDQNYTQALQICHDRLVAEGIDLSSYTSAANAADVEDLRKALGYTKWNLFGSSYGTRLALTVMRDYPDGVRSVILDSVYPPQVDLFNSVTPNFERSLNLVFEHCTMDAACNQAYPDIKTQFYQFVDQLDIEPQIYNIYNPSEGKFLDVYINGDRFIWATFQTLYMTDQIPNLPLRIDSLQRGTSSSFPQLLQSFILFDSWVDEGMHYSIQCNEEVPFTTLEAFNNDNANVTPRLADALDNIQIFQYCSVWGSTPADPVENQAVVSDIPTLIFSGEFDPITPPEWGRLVGETLSKSQFLEFPGFGHGILGNEECSSQLVTAFLNDPNETVDARCLSAYELEFRIK